jgi:predicted nuclease of predicted toxin-antitoxin system
VGKKVENWLMENGYDIKSVRNIDPRMADDEILKIAVSDDRMVMTMDKDFGELIYNSGLVHSGVLLLRLEDTKSDEKVKIVEKILSLYKEKLLNNFCVYQKAKFRIKK